MLAGDVNINGDPTFFIHLLTHGIGSQVRFVVFFTQMGDGHFRKTGAFDNAADETCCGFVRQMTGPAPDPLFQ